MSATRIQLPCAKRSRPRCRLLCAPWIATLPNTAIAPVAAIASERARLERERSSITARYGASAAERALRDGRTRARSRSSSDRQEQQQRHDEAHDPDDRSLRGREQDRRGRSPSTPGRRQHQPRSVAPRPEGCAARTRPPGARRSPRAAARARRRAPPAARRRRASAMLCHVTIRCAPIGKREATDSPDSTWNSATESSSPSTRPRSEASDTEHQRVEQQHLDDHPARVAVEAQVLDQVPALGHREQHRVEREQEADERADRREQHGGLVGRPGGLGGTASRRSPPGARSDARRARRSQTRSHLAIAPGLRAARRCSSGVPAMPVSLCA